MTYEWKPILASPVSAPGQLAVVFGLTGLAITQPMLAFLGENPTFFTFRGASGFEIFLLAAVIAVVPPIALWLLGLGTSAVNEKAGAVVHLTTCIALTTLALLPLLHNLPHGAIAVPIVVVADVGIVLLYTQFKAAASFLRYLSILPALAVLSFTFASPTSDFARVSPLELANSTKSTDLPPVVFIVLDEFGTQSLLDESDQIDSVRFPNLSAFAAEANWYRHYTALTTHTTYSVPSILTGRWPREVEPLWPEYPESLFTYLAPSHDIIAFESFTELCGLPSCTGASDGFSALVADALDSWTKRLLGTSQVEAREDFGEDLVAGTPQERLFSAGMTLLSQPAKQQAFLDSIRPSNEPTLYFQHLVMPHSPFRLYPDGTIYESPNLVGATDAPWLQATDQQRHLLQAQYTDALIGQTLDALTANGLFDDALIVITSDHGISFEAGTPRRDYVPGTVADHAYSLLLIKEPGQASGSIDDQNLMSVDILPTVADILGMPIPWPVDGYPASSAAIAERGGTKRFWDVSRIVDGAEFLGTFEFEDETEFPNLQQRWIGAIAPTDEPLAGLHRILGSSELIGEDVDSLDVETTSEIAGSLDDADALAQPSAPPLALVSGTVAAEPNTEILVAVDGVVVTGSPVFDDGTRSGRFTAMLPAPEVGRPIEPELFVWSPDGTLARVGLNGT